MKQKRNERLEKSAGMLHMGLCDTLLIRHLVDPQRGQVFTWSRDCTCRNDDCSCWEYVSNREANEEDLEQYKLCSVPFAYPPPPAEDTRDAIAGLTDKYLGGPTPGHLRYQGGGE